MSELSDVDVARLADAIAERLGRPRGLLTVRQAAEYLAVDDAYVYRHAEALGAVRLGDGERPRLRFRAEDLDAFCSMSRRSPAPVDGPDPAPAGGSSPAARRRRGPRMGTGAPLLPIRGGSRP